MPTLHHLNLPDYACFATTKTLGGRRYFADAHLASLVQSAIYHCRDEGWLYLLAFVIMPDHLHLVFVPRSKTPTQVLQSIKGFSARAIDARLGRRGRIWQPGFHDLTLDRRGTLLEKVRYVHENPVRAGLVAEAAQYPFSSANPLLENDLALV